MLQSLEKLYGCKLGASDGEIGHVKDFYFDDRSWAVRYLVANTGTWLPGRQVLISPHSIGRLHVAGNVISVNLSRKQIEDSPPIETHKPVSRQYEEAYYRFYGWPYYWQGDGLWGSSGIPILELPAKPFTGAPIDVNDVQPESSDPHLRSAKAVNGYHLETSDGIIGHVCDFMVNIQSWAIEELVIKTGRRLTGKEVQITTTLVDRISYEDSTVFVKMTGDAVEQSPTHQLVSVGEED